MKRYAIQELGQWKGRADRKPLLLLGARQVGKTWLMQEFGRVSYRNTAYVRFDTKPQIREIFEQGADIPRLLAAIQYEVGFRPEPGETLIVFDEIQECPAALTSLKYFCEEAPEYHVIAAGSQLGIRTTWGSGFPVGKVDFMRLYPMCFTEYLEATGYARLAELLQAGDMDMVNAFRAELEEQLRRYYYVGGMPEAVRKYAESGDFSLARKEHERLLASYEMDFGKHVPKELLARVQLLWKSIPGQLARENKKFLCSAVGQNLRTRELREPLEWLRNAGLIELVPRVKVPSIPLSAYEDGAFKVFFLDVGLLGAKSGLDLSVLLDRARVFREFKGALAEQFVQQEMRAVCGIAPSYWSSPRSDAEIDFLFQYGMDVLPVEVKAETNLQAKSLKSYCQQYQPPKAVRSSLSPFQRQEVPFLKPIGGAAYELLNIPLYALCRLPQLLDAGRGM